VSKSKICRVCGFSFPLKAFHNNKRNLDGKSNTCIVCRKKYEKDRIANKDPIVDNKCTGCNTVLPISEFHKNKGKCKGIESRCKSCRNTRIVEKRYGL
jgi:hypothetical protein